MSDSAPERYRTIVADPPWDLGQTGFTFHGGANRPSHVPYPTLTVDEIAAMPVNELADDDAHLYLWTTNRFLRAAFDVLDAWGFTYSTPLVWAKAVRGWMPGGTFPSHAEFVLYGRRGTPETLGRADRQVFEWPRSGHSVKPEAFLDLVETISPGPYLEVFARRARLGWHVYGNEVDSHVELGTIDARLNVDTTAFDAALADLDESVRP